MTKTIITLLSLLLILALVACSPAGDAGDIEGKAPEPASLLGSNSETALPVLTQLVVGTFKLEDSDLAVDAKEAAELLPLWKAYRSLSSSDSASSLELKALVTQIQEAMTSEQMQAIAQMKLTGADMAALAQERGIEMVQGGDRGDLSPEQIATMQALRSAGGGGERGGGERGGGIPGMGGGPGAPGGVPGTGGAGAGESPSADQVATLRAQRGGSAGLGISSVFFDALIELLEQKAGLAS